jgi:hypothetical protein
MTVVYFQPNEVIFIPVLIEPVETIPSHFSRICMIDGRGDKFEKVAENLTEKIIQWRLNKEEIFYLQKPVVNTFYLYWKNKL